MLTIAEEWEQQAREKWIRQGIEQGIERGIEQGIGQGQARLLRQLLNCRFGALPPWVETRLADAEPARLETWARRVLDAASLEAVFDERG